MTQCVFVWGFVFQRDLDSIGAQCWKDKYKEKESMYGKKEL